MTQNRPKLLGLALGFAAAAIGGWLACCHARGHFRYADCARRSVSPSIGHSGTCAGPLLWYTGLAPKEVSFGGVLPIWIGAGLPFGLLAMFGTLGRRFGRGCSLVYAGGTYSVAITRLGVSIPLLTV
jgi:hypothetical protein